MFHLPSVSQRMLLFSSCTACFCVTILWLHAQCSLMTQVSGATATVAVIVGWDLVVASVGDSTAYLDTGAEVVQVSSV